MFKRNLNLKANEDLELCSEVSSNLHKQIYSQVVKTKTKQTFLSL